MKRRSFLKTTGIATAYGLFGAADWGSFLSKPELTQLTLLHTNDLHSRIHPFPEDAGERAGLGGFTRLSAVVDNIRSTVDHSLLLDCGDVLQGTPYFNLFEGKLEFQLMSKMGYDAGTIGNHEFDAGIERLAKNFEYLNFPMISSNYDFSNTPLSGKVLPYHTLNKGGIKVGIFGLGIELFGLVPEQLFGNTVYKDPIPVSQEVSTFLKKEANCDLVICLSHLGYEYEGDKVSDRVIASESENIDVILGGHTHTFLEGAQTVANKKGEAVLVNQAGRSGKMLGRIDLVFEKNRKGRCISCVNIPIGS